MKFDLSREFDQGRATEYLKKLIEHGKPCEIKEIRPRRSGRANRYYWAIISFWAIHAGYTRDEMHTVCKRRCGLVYERNGEKFLRSTADLDSAEMAQYIDWIRNTAAAQDCYLASPEEYEQGGYVEIDEFIERNKEYL